MFYTFEKSDINTYQLEQEISLSADILSGWKSVIVRGEILEITMKAALGPSEQSALAAIVATHLPKAEYAQPAIVSVVENEKFDSLGIELTYRMRPFVFDIPAQTGEHYFEISFPYPIMLLGGTVDMHTAMVGDSMRFCTLAPTPIGQLPNAIASGTNKIVLPSEIGDICFKGLDMLINMVYVGRIIKINKGAGICELILDRELEQDFLAGGLILIGYTTVEKYLITAAPLVLWVSRDTERGAMINANQTMGFNYWNDTGTAKKVQLAIEYYS